MSEQHINVPNGSSCSQSGGVAAAQLAGSKTLNNISRPPAQLNNSLRGEWRWFRHLGALRAGPGSPRNHITAQVTYEFVAFPFLHSSGTK